MTGYDSAMSLGGESANFVNIDDWESAATGALPREIADYVAGGAGEEWTMRENRRAFDRWVILPRVLIDVSNVDTSTTVLGRRLPLPFLLAPTAFHRLVHADGELATARAAAAIGAAMILSTMSSVSLEEVAATGVTRWFQLYVHRDRGLTAELVRRAHAAGFEALVLTVDAPRLGRRERDERNGFVLPEGVGNANLEEVAGANLQSASHIMQYFAAQIDPGVTWEDVAWLRTLSPLPLVLKGVMSGRDAELAAQAGVEAIVVSNHGGRQLDGAMATLDALPEVVSVADGRLEVLVDGGIRRGHNVMKALALGARAVLVGRPCLWGLAVEGEAGVRRVLEMLRDETALSMALAGVGSVADIGPSLVARAPVR